MIAALRIIAIPAGEQRSFFSGAETASKSATRAQLVFLHKILNNKVSDIAPLVGDTPEALTAKLTAAGYAATPDAVLSDIQAKAGKSDVQLIGVLMPKP